MFQRNSLTYLTFFLMDISLTLLALRVAKFLRETIPLGVYLDEPLIFSPWLYLTIPLIWLVVFTALKVYSPARALRYATRADIPAVWGAITGASLIFAGVAYLLFRELSRFLFFYFFILDLIFLGGWRWLLPLFPKFARWLYGAERRRVLIVGASQTGQQLAQAITQHPAIPLTLVGFADNNHKIFNTDPNHFPILGTLSNVPHLVKESHIQEVIFALPPDKYPALRSIVMALQTTSVNLRLIPDVFNLVFLRASVEEFAGIPIIGLREPAIHELDRLLKRLFDLVISLFLLLLLSPLMIILAILIKLDTVGPIFFRQRRVGEDGRLFWMYKFRSMVEGAEKEEPQLVQETLEGQAFFDKSPHDHRVTKVGRLLRRTSLDELPQLFNVLKGDMSLVGPRPELPHLAERYEPWQCKRLSVPQGMTGWWQVNGRMKRANPQQRVEDDLFYIRNYSLWLDLRILWKTIRTVIRGEGAF